MEIINGSDLVGKRYQVLDNGDLREVKGKFVPKVCDEYWVVSRFGGCEHYLWNGDVGDYWLLNHNPVFRTKAEAEEYKYYLETLDKYTFEPDWENEKQEKYYLAYNHKAEGPTILRDESCTQRAMLYFPTIDDVEAFITEVGNNEAIKRFMFNIWD